MINGASPINDPLMGLITVYREFKVARDSVEYTVYFREDGNKYRMDFELLMVAMENIKPENLEGYIQARMHERFERGEYKLAAVAVPGQKEKYVV